MTFPRFPAPLSLSSLRLNPLCMACLVLLAGPALAQNAPPSTQLAQANSLREVVVSGSRSERAIEDVPASIDVITGEDLDPARVQDIRDLVREVPNMSVRRAPQRFGGVTGSTGRDGNAGFNLRGLEGNRVLLTVDGIRVPRELSSGVFGSASFGRDYYDLGLISRVEIVRGANSALYGSDGLAGMVAMFTTEPKDLLKPGQTLGGRVGLKADSEDHSRGVGVTLVGAPNDTLQWLGSVQVGRSGELDNQGTNESLNSARTAPNPQKDKNVSLLGKVVLTPGAGQRHTLTLEHVDKSGEVEAYTARATSMGVTALDVDGTTDMERTRLSWDGRFKVDSAWADELRATLGYQQAESQEVSTERRTAAPTYRVRDVTYTEKLWQGVLQAEKARSLGADWGQKLVYGVDVSVAKMDNLVTGVGAPSYETYPLKRFPPTSETNTALFVQSEFATERWSLIPALRYDHISLQRDTLANNTTATPTPFSTFKKGYRTYTGRVGGVFILTKEINAYASFSRAAEPVTQLVSLVATSADFSLQKGQQYEAGLKGTFLRGKLDATVAVFDLLKKDLLTSTTDPVTGIRTNQQIGAQKSQGIEAALAVSPGDGWRVELNGAFTDSEYADFNENLGTGIISRAGKRPSNVPEWVANFFVAKRFANGFALSGGPRYVSDRFGNTNNSVVADGYVVLDASASYTYRRTTFTLRGRNLLDETYQTVAGTTMRRLSDPRTAELSIRSSF